MSDAVATVTHTARTRLATGVVGAFVWFALVLYGLARLESGWARRGRQGTQ